MALKFAKSLRYLLGEIDVQRIQALANRPVRLVLTGDETLSLRLKERLGDTPWVSLLYDSDALKKQDIEICLHRDYSDFKPVENENILHVVVSDKGLEGVNPLLPQHIFLPDLEEDTLERIFAPHLLQIVPEPLKLSLARHLPLMRDAYASQLIEQTSNANALYALSSGFAKLTPVLNVPLALADNVILSKNQIIMMYKLALAEGRTGTIVSILKEVISVVGGAFLSRQAARGLVGLVPGWGIIPRVSVAYAGTWVIGQTVFGFLRSGKTKNISELNQHYQSMLKQGKVLAQRLLKREQ